MLGRQKAVYDSEPVEVYYSEDEIISVMTKQITKRERALVGMRDKKERLKMSKEIKVAINIVKSICDALESISPSRFFEEETK